MILLKKKLGAPVLGWFLLFAALFWCCMAYVFYPVLPRDWVMLSPDAPKYYPTCSGTNFIETLLAGKDGVVPFFLFLNVIPPLIRQELFYMVASFLAAMAGFYYLRTQNVSRLAAFGGGLFFAFSGYSFTLFCAGHGGYFMNISCGLFAFGLINRCFQTKRFFYYVMLGATLIWAEYHQPDTWLLFVFLIAAYGVWRTIREWRVQKNMSFLARVYPRFVLTILTIALIGSQQIKGALTDTLRVRREQFSEASSVRADTKTADVDQAAAQKKFERWIFSTNWSLPPEDMLEFIVPGVFGNCSFQMPYPYWGRLGQPYAFQKGRMMPNYRQHTVYLGITAFLFALFAVWCWLALRRQSKVPQEVLSEKAVKTCFEDVPFWAGAWIVCAVIALGRYTPVYHFIYSYLPYMDYLRAPVKFHHLVEISNAFLAAFGIEYFRQAGSEAAVLRKRFGYFCGGCVVLLIAGYAVMQLWATAIEHYISSIGFGQLATPLREYASANFLRSIGLACTIGMFFAAASRKSNSAKTITVLAVSVIVLNTIDLASVARRYVIPVNVGPHHAANPVVKAMQARTGNRPANVMNYVTSGGGEQDWFSMALELNGFANMAPKPDEKDTPRALLFDGLRNSPVRYWQLTGVRFVLMSRTGVEAFAKQGLLSVLCDFEIGQGTVRTIPPSGKSFVLAEVIGFPGLPALYFNWKGAVPPDQQIAEALKDPADRMVAEIAPEPDMGSHVLPQRVRFDAMRKMPYALSTHGNIESPCPGLLIVNEPFSKEFEAFVDGVEVPVVQANGLWASIRVPEGRHRVVLRIRRAWGWNALSLLTSLAVLVWAVVRLGRTSPNH